MDESHRRAWTALELGPVWRLRDGNRSGATDASQAVQGDAPSSMTAPKPDAAAAPPPLAEVDRRVGSPEEADIDVAPAPATPGTGVSGLGWAELRKTVATCRACTLCESRTQTVFGVGEERARWLIVGEAPGAEEDARGEPFVGQAGKLLDNMLAALGLTRERDVFIANVLKCRPPNNRNPEPDEVANCAPFLQRQIELLAPEVIVAMGRFAAQSLLRTDATIASLRGKVHRHPVNGRPVPLVVTYHPAYLLRSLADKSKAWSDLCLARSCLTAER